MPRLLIGAAADVFQNGFERVNKEFLILFLTELADSIEKYLDSLVKEKMS
ncbi:hypothetical protein [Floccifex sp.]